MFVCIDLKKQVKVGEVIVIKADNRGNIGAFLVSGEQVGYLSDEQPEGCISYWTVMRNIFNNRILCQVAIKCGEAAILNTESDVLRYAKRNYKRVETEGYGMIVPAYANA